MISSSTSVIQKLQHPRWGHCDLIRVEATDWIVRLPGTGKLYRFPSEARGQFQVIQDLATTAPQALVRSTPIAPASAQARRARRVIESLRIGLPAGNGETRELAVGRGEIERHIGHLLMDVDVDGGRAMVIRGAYGQGKTFALRMLEEAALERGYLTARTEIDATENRLSKPHDVYRDLMLHLRLPGDGLNGVRGLVKKTCEEIERGIPGAAPQDREAWLEQRLGCFPLSWLLSDPQAAEKEELIGMLSCDPNFPAARGRQAHVTPAEARYWPAFSAGTQGDFASFVLCGIGRLSRLLGYKGFVIIMDEMEKWQELNWQEQAQAGNLLGGLIWGATAEAGRRGDDDLPRALAHSGRGGGYPFSTVQPCHVGIAIAMTPRGDQTPESVWDRYAPIEIAHLPEMTEKRLGEYCRLIASRFTEAYGMAAPDARTMKRLVSEAVVEWKKQGILTTRSGVQSAISALDRWREQAGQG